MGEVQPNVCIIGLLLALRQFISCRHMSVGDAQCPHLLTFGQRGFQDEVATGGLKSLHQITGPGVEHLMPGLDHGMADGAQDVDLSGAGIADCDQVAAALPPVAGRQGLDPGARQGRQRLEVESCQCFAGGQLRLVEMSPDAAHVTLGQLVFGMDGQETGGRPAFCICAGGDLCPEFVEAREPQRGQHAG